MDTYLEPHFGTSALITIDMQRDFVDGEHAIPGTKRIVAKLAELTRAYRGHALPLLHAMRLYEIDGSNAETCRRSQILSGRSIVAPGSKAAELTPELIGPDLKRVHTQTLSSDGAQQLGCNEFAFYKPRWSAFFETGLAVRLKNLQVDTIVVGGCNFPNCPTATLFDASALNFRMVLASDATSMLDKDGTERVRRIGVIPMTVREIVAQLPPINTR